MLLSVSGLASVYEIEHIARMFYRDLILRDGFCRLRCGDELEPATRHRAAVLCDGVIAMRAGSRKLLAALRTPQGVRLKTAQRPADGDCEFALCRLLYLLLCDATGTRPPWGVLTGVRPVRLVHQLWQQGKSDEEVRDYFTGRCPCQPRRRWISRSPPPASSSR